MSKLDPLCFANGQEVHCVEVNEPHLFKVKYEALFAAIDLCLQLLYLLRFNSAA
jgi:hypothetical protein